MAQSYKIFCKLDNYFVEKSIYSRKNSNFVCDFNLRDMEITGKVIAVLEARGGISTKTGNSWKTQDYVIETHEQFPRRMCFNVFGEDKINQFNIQVGDELNVSFDINAREYQGKWYNDIRAWNVTKAEGEVPPQLPPDDMPPFEADAPAASSAEQTDDLPF